MSSKSYPEEFKGDGPRRHILSSRRGLFKGLRTDVPEMAVAPGPVVEHFNVIEDIRPGQAAHFVYYLLMRSFVSELTNDSPTALSQQLPRRLILGQGYWPDRTVGSRRCCTGCPGLSER